MLQAHLMLSSAQVVGVRFETQFKTVTGTVPQSYYTACIARFGAWPHCGAFVCL